MKKLIAIDIDGTLINSKHEISAKTKQILIEAQKQGHKVMISSGRSPKGVEKYYKELELDKYEGYICNYNGAVVTDVKTNEVIINHTLDFEKMKEMLKFSKTQDIYFVIYFNNIVYTDNLSTYNLDDVLIKNDTLLKYVPNLVESIDFMPNNILFTQAPSKMAEPSKNIFEKFKDDFEFVYSEPFYFEAMPKNVSKGETLVEVAKKLGYSIEDTVAFGDQGNDFTMIKLAGTGVAMGNAIDELKENSDFVTKTNDEDGVADYIEKYILD